MATITKKTAGKTATNRKKLDAKNEEALIEQGKTALVKTKYIYPKDCITPKQRKAHRRVMRASIKKHEKTIANLKKDKAPKTHITRAVRAFNKFQKENLA